MRGLGSRGGWTLPRNLSNLPLTSLIDLERLSVEKVGHSSVFATVLTERYASHKEVLAHESRPVTAVLDPIVDV